MVVQDTRPWRGGVEGPIKGVMGRLEQATDPAPGTGGRGAHTGRPERRTAQPLTRQDREGYPGP